MRLVILGAGGYGKTVADVARQSGEYDEILFLDDHAAEAAGRCGEFAQFIKMCIRDRDIVEHVYRLMMEE